MNNYKVAVVLSGHARMVPQGNHLHHYSFDRALRCASWDQFSYCWTESSEVRHATPEQRAQFELRDQILEGLGSRHHYEDQVPMFDQLCNRFIDQGALPDFRKSNPIVAAQVRYHFGKYLGQLLGFCLAIDRWRDELSKYDFIVRSRWDHTLDPTMLDDLDPEFFYTKSINIWDGRPIVSGDTIYGSTERWLKLIPSTEDVIRRLILGCRRTRAEIAVKQPKYNFAQDFQWYTTHYLWYVLVENEPIRWLHRGENFGIKFELSKIPLNQLTLAHAAYGPEYKYDVSQLPPVSGSTRSPAEKVYKNQTEQLILERKERRRAELAEKIKSQSHRPDC